jgi:HlyD family secretion protein
VTDLSEDLKALRINRAPPPQQGRGALGTVVVVVAVVAVLGGASVVGKPALEEALFRAEVEVTEITRVSPMQGSVDLTASGYVVAERVAKVGPVVPGRVTRVNVKEGQAVRAGDTLLELDVGDQQGVAATMRARAAAATARARVARAQAAELRQRLERDRPLAEQGVVARAPVDDLLAQQGVAEESARAAEGEARAAAADARASGAQLRHGALRAPIDGVVVGRPPELGDVLNPAAFSAAFELVDLASLVVEVDVPEARLALIKPGAPGEIVLDAAPDARLRAEVKQITPRVNRSKATVAVKVRFVDRPALVYPEMAARVSFLARALDDEARKAPPKVVVPGAAVVERDGGKVVFLVDGGKARLQRVTLGAPVGDGFELLSGPPPGTRIIRSPQPSLADGKTLKERNAR